MAVEAAAVAVTAATDVMGAGKVRDALSTRISKVRDSPQHQHELSMMQTELTRIRSLIDLHAAARAPYAAKAKASSAAAAKAPSAAAAKASSAAKAKASSAAKAKASSAAAAKAPSAVMENYCGRWRHPDTATLRGISHKPKSEAERKAEWEELHQYGMRMIRAILRHDAGEEQLKEAKERRGMMREELRISMIKLHFEVAAEAELRAKLRAEFAKGN